MTSSLTGLAFGTLDLSPTFEANHTAYTASVTYTETGWYEYDLVIGKSEGQYITVDEANGKGEYAFVSVDDDEQVYRVRYHVTDVGSAAAVAQLFRINVYAGNAHTLYTLRVQHVVTPQT